MIKHSAPRNWLRYDLLSLVGVLTEAKAAVLSLVNIPYQRSWVEELQSMQLKYEVAGTSRIEGADFTEGELNLALKDTPEQLVTRSQKQAHAAMNAYKWIAALPKDVPVDSHLIKRIHTLIIGDADIDHCPPGKLRTRDQNVVFGVPPHRGSQGGRECEASFNGLCGALKREFPRHDPLIQALALHFHLAAMHPFLDGNGRTARALEALMLQRSGLTDHLFIAMSNYYYDEKIAYLSALSSVTPPHYDLTPFLEFGLKGIKIQCQRLFNEIRKNVSKSIFKNTMYDLFGPLRTGRKAVLAKRHIAILNTLLEQGEMSTVELHTRIDWMYKSLKAGAKTRKRDLFHLIDLGAIRTILTDEAELRLSINLDWPTQITESGFMEKAKRFPLVKGPSPPPRRS